MDFYNTADSFAQNYRCLFFAFGSKAGWHAVHYKANGHSGGSTGISFFLIYLFSIFYFQRDIRTIYCICKLER